MVSPEQLNEIVSAIAKRSKDTILPLSEQIPSVTVVEGDEIESYFLSVNFPYRKSYFSRELSGARAVIKLQQLKSKYESMAKALQREIDWIQGDE